MKKKLIWLAVICVVILLGLVAVSSSAVRAWLSSSALFGGLYAWARTNFGEVYQTLRYGAHRFAYAAIILLVVISLVSFLLLKVPAVDDSTVEPKPVTQKPYITKENGKATMVVVEENEGGK